MKNKSSVSAKKMRIWSIVVCKYRDEVYFYHQNNNMILNSNILWAVSILVFTACSQDQNDQIENSEVSSDLTYKIVDTGIKEFCSMCERY